MCRNKDKRDGRCPCDTSEARRLRRHNNSARKLYASFVSNLIPTKFLPSVAVKDSNTVENIKQDIQYLNTLLEALGRYTGDSTPLLLAYDAKLNSIGAAIEYLAEEKYGAPTDEQLREVARESEEAYEIHKKSALEANKTKDEAHKYANEQVQIQFGVEIIEKVGTLLQTRNEAIKRALTDAGVQFADPETIEVSEDSDESALNSLKKALTYYPQSWVDASNRKHKEYPLHVKNSDKRAQYDPVSPKGKYSELTVNEDTDFFVGNDAGMCTALHEFAHRVEHSEIGITASEEIFLLRRAGHLPSADGLVDPEPLTLIYPDDEVPDGEEEELGYRDNFPVHYMGKSSKKTDAREILSTGMESLFAGMYGGFTGLFKHKSDSDYKKFILGLLASSAKNP